MTTSYDAIIVGAGQAGPSLAARPAGSGMKVALVERKLVGGTCVNTGCTPTKAMVASAYAAHMARRAGDYGVRGVGEITVDMNAVKARKDAIYEAYLTREWYPKFVHHARLVALSKNMHEHQATCTSAGKDGNGRPSLRHRKIPYSLFTSLVACCERGTLEAHSKEGSDVHSASASPRTPPMTACNTSGAIARPAQTMILSQS